VSRAWSARQCCESLSAILNLGLAVVHWIFGPSRDAFSVDVDVPHKKCSLCGNPGGGPPSVVIGCQGYYFYCKSSTDNIIYGGPLLI
jgi:hypothetical protein